MTVLRLFLFLAMLPLLCGATTVHFDPLDPTVGPFPSNVYTVSTGTQQTGLQISLPLPAGCTSSSTSTACVNAILLNQLDGFSVNPRIAVCFSGKIDVNTLTAGISIWTTTNNPTPIAISQVIFDPLGNCVYAKPAQVLNQQTEYLLSVTTALKDGSEVPLQADAAFSKCAKGVGSAYCTALAEGIQDVYGKKTGNLISAALFTTMSATSWLEKARAQVNSGSIPEAVLPAGFVSTFNVASISSITWMPQTDGPPLPPDQTTIPTNVLQGVEKISFGLYLSPQYLNQAGPQSGTITTTPTNLPISTPTAITPVSFHVFLPPAASAKAGGFPVIVYGHGLGDTQFGAPTYAASTWAQKGFATLAIEITGHGEGFFSTTQITTNSGNYTVWTPGRGVQLSPAAAIGPTDGCILPGALATRDCARQTAVDLSALVRIIRDSNGLGMNLNPSRIYFVGQSFGSIYGSMFEAVEPNVAAATLNAWGGTQTDVAQLSPIAGTLGALYLNSYTPSLLNGGGFNGFNSEYVYPGQVITDSVTGALAIQAAFAQSDWLGMLGDALSYAGHLQTSPLTGVAAKPTLVQFGTGDIEVPNPTELAVMLAAGLQSSTWLLRTDIAFYLDSNIFNITVGAGYPIYPHRFLSNPIVLNPAYPFETALAVAAQMQIADFFASANHGIPNPNQYMGQYGACQPNVSCLFQSPPNIPDALNFFFTL